MGPPHTTATDIVLCQEMADIVEKLTTNGKAELDKDSSKRLKAICKQSDEYVKHAHHLIMTQLEKDHSEIRLSSLLLVDELFCRSHCFRELVLADFQYFMELTIEIDHDFPLPPPKPAAKLLKTKTISCIQQWNERYGEAYKKLSLGYHFLKNCKKINFESIRAETQAELRREEERRIRQEHQQRERLNKAITELTETNSEIQTCLVQAEACLHLLFPDLQNFTIYEAGSPEPDGSKSPLGSPRRRRASRQTSVGSGKGSPIRNQESLNHKSQINEFITGENASSSITTALPDFQNEGTNDSKVVDITAQPSTSGYTLAQNNTKQDSNDETDSDFEEVSDLEEFSGTSEDDNETNSGALTRQHGFGSKKFSLQINLPTPRQIDLEETADNTDILSTLKDIICLIGNKFIPAINKCLEAFGKNGGEQKHIKQALDLKADLVAVKTKITQLKVTKMTDKITDQSNPLKGTTGSTTDEEDEEGFEEVPLKEGYEADVPEQLREAKKPLKPASCRDWTLPKDPGSGGCSIEEQDPTTWLSSVKKFRETVTAATGTGSSLAVPSTTRDPQPSSSSSNPLKENLLRKAPVVPFGLDLYHWGADPKEAPSRVRNNQDSHRFWRPPEDEDCVVVDQEALAQMKTRVINFTGQFEPVKWKCRAPLPTGKLCDRMDRKKCPFHGTIIPRNELGEPTRPEDIERLARLKEQKDKDIAQGWDDPELQQDIMAATGIDLSRKGKGRGKGKAKQRKYPELTDIRKLTNTNRNRLKSKVLNRGALKRVAAAMDNLDHKRYKDKFGNQFNYAHSQT